MSQLFKLAKSKLNQVIVGNKSNQSTSSFGSGLVVGDSYQTFGALVTNVATGALSGLISLFVLFGLSVLFGGSNVFATASSINISVTSGSGAYVNIPPTAEGKFGIAGPTTFSVSTDHISGYTLTASASNLSFTDAEGNNGTVGATYTIDNLPANTAINADEFESNSNYKNKWGYLPDKYYNTSTSATVTNNTNFFPAPITTPQTLDITNAPNVIEPGETERTPNDYNLTLGTKLDHTVAQGQYTTTITLTAVANPTPYTINYYKNVPQAEESTVTNMPTSPETGSVDGDTATLSTTIPQRPGYTFSRWCVATTTEACYTSDNTTGAGNVYKPGGSYTLDQTQANTLNVYALWKVNPCDTSAYPNANSYLYCKAQNQNKGTQTTADLRTEIVTPTAETTTSTNSGVYEYDPDTFGIASDANNNYNIYYYRGVLDTFAGLGTYGSDGQADAYPNYVKLGNNTCWRIVRTTGSGGVKMIYNGTYGATTSGSCGNATEMAQINGSGGRISYAAQGTSTNEDWSRNVAYVGYTYNDAVTDSEVSTSVGIVFGDNNNYAVTNTKNSNIKTYVEDWYSDNVDNYTDMFELSAGYCNDRTVYYYGDNIAREEILPFTTSDTLDDGGAFFGSRIRIDMFWQKGGIPTLNCPRGSVDLYTVTGAVNGNGQLDKPIALLDADEFTLMGSGYYGSTVIYNANSFLRNGFIYWSLSPGARMVGQDYQFHLSSEGFLNGGYGVHMAYGARPVVSLVSGTTVTGGNGTATNPWTIAEPSSP